ncbi:translocation/assembly module TamB domain-containing protein [Belliella kenyensis]|uniref:Translocation/assembly module TamB domain-containing protein n=1 Tax=Belliella kenyensis TaxID=1472724 RepID=A0ABV8ENS9_9BACT|nr:translocation/assembly module TamB domain-containing protein [Belliella kenyensis]MDN3605127.1 translocation/assembly module TamB domain-containing protein [Belliella kenyensis]
MILFIRSPWGQGIIVNKATAYVSGKTGTEISINRLFVTFQGNVYLEGLYLEDLEADTLLYSKNLEVGFGLVKFLRTGEIDITKLDWEGLKANVYREEGEGNFNYQFIIDAFVSPQDTTSTSVDDTEIQADEETSEPLKVSIAPVKLKDFELKYEDVEGGMMAFLSFEELLIDVPHLDLDKFEFDINEVSLVKSKVSYIQSKSSEEKEEEESSTSIPLLIALKKLKIEEIDILYHDQVNQQKASVNLGSLEVSMPEFDLEGQKVILNSLDLKKSDIAYQDFSPQTFANTKTSDQQNEASSFEWPEWFVEVGYVDLENINLIFKTKDVSPRKGFFNPESMEFKDLNLNISNVALADKSAKLKLRNFNFQEAGGFELQQFAFGVKLDDNRIEVDDLKLNTNRSELRASVDLSYASIDQLIERPELVNMNLKLNRLSADLRDAFYFEPDLAKDQMIKQISSNPILARASVKGDMSAVRVSDFQTSWSDAKITAKGSLRNVLDTDQLYFDFPDVNLEASGATIGKFLSEAQRESYQLPEKVHIEARAKGKLEDLLSEIKLESDLGNLDLLAKYKDSGSMSFDIELKVNEFQLGNLLKNPSLDTLTFSLEAVGEGADISSLNASLTSNFERLKLNGNDYSGLELSGELVDGNGDVKMALDADDLKFELLTKLALDTVNYDIELKLDLQGADLFALGFTPQDTRAKLLFEAHFEGNEKSFDLKTRMTDALVVFDQRTYPLGRFDIDAKIREDETNFSIKSLMLNGEMKSNASPDVLIESITHHLRTYIDTQDTLENLMGEDVKMNLNLKINQAPILNQVLLPALEKLDTATLQIDFDLQAALLTTRLDFPYLKYGGIELDSLGLRIKADVEDLDLAFGFLKLNTGPLDMGKTYFTGELEDSRLYFDFNSFDGDERMVHVASDIGLFGDTLSIHISPEALLLNKRDWNIPENNEILLASNYIHFQDFKFTRNNQSLSIRDDVGNVAEEHIALEFSEFRLETFTSLLNPEELIAGGLLNGQLIVENPFGALGFLAELKIQDLKALNVPLGNLSLDAEAENLGEYVLKLALKDGGIDLDLTGNFMADEAGATFDLDLDINKIEMGVVADLSGGELRDAAGQLKGKVNASGSTSEPNYKGDLVFDDASFVVSQLNAKYTLSNERLSVDNQGVKLDKFTIRDADNQSFIIDGSILTDDLTNPSFDMKLVAKNFRAVSSTRDDNDLFFGTAIIDADVSIRGDLNLPRVTADLKVKDGTDFNVIIPESQLDMVKRDGTVIFVNRQDPFDILTRQTDESINAFTGYDIRAVLKVDPNAVFKAIVDERSGDNLSVSGQADLNMEINPNGRITLSGTYELTKGHYEMSLYNLVSRRFEIAEGSTISWNGDPMDANLSISAIYNVRTASSELMASQISGTSADARVQYQQELPFMVYLNVDGELLRPEISFRLDMPEDQRGALGGNVYSRVLQVNDQEDELNKQVFSLLVLNRFFPSQGSDGSGGGTSAIARSSVSQVLSGQLNALSSNIFGNSGLELDFDLDSFTDFQSGTGQDRTQLNVNARKRFFDDRLIVQVGSQMDIEGSSQNPDQANAVLGNVSLEYMLTENGRYRVRAFRKNQFESIIDGQLIVTGFGLIFNREFNEFFELWKGVDASENRTNPIDSIERKEEEDEEEKKKNETQEAEKKEEEENEEVENEKTSNQGNSETLKREKNED